VDIHSPTSPTPDLDPSVISDPRPLRKVDPDVVDHALGIVNLISDIPEEARISAWGSIERAAESYVDLVNSKVFRPVGKGVIGDVVRAQVIYFCVTHGWSADKDECWFPEWALRSLKPWRRIGQYRKARSQCVIEPRLLFPVAPFE
jgi:hypothetical protein